MGYLAMLTLAYLSVTPPASLCPDIHDLNQVLWRNHQRQPSLIERLLESDEGPRNRGGTMRPAFTTESKGWESLTEGKSDAEIKSLLKERENERLALLDWVRAGAPREAYECDKYVLVSGGGIDDATEEFMAGKGEIHIRSLINARCVFCHNESSGHEQARWFPLDSYERFERYCRSEALPAASSFWPITSLLALLPLTAIGGLLTCCTPLPSKPRLIFALAPAAGSITAVCCWLASLGNAFTYFLLAAVFVAVLGLAIQMALVLRLATSD